VTGRHGRPSDRPHQRPETSAAAPVEASAVGDRRPRTRRRDRLRPATATKLALSVVLLMGLWTVAGGGTYAALSGSTANTGNTFSAGTVTMTDNDSTTALFAFTNQEPGVVENACIKVNYTGSVNASVKLFGSVSGTMAPYLNLTVTRGTDSSPSFDSCANFTPDATNYSGLGAGVLFSGTLSSFPTTYATAITDPDAAWTNVSSASYRFTVEVVDDNAVQGLTSGATFTWEARS
jgi:hypothetical protein